VICAAKCGRGDELLTSFERTESGMPAQTIEPATQTRPCRVGGGWRESLAILRGRGGSHDLKSWREEELTRQDPPGDAVAMDASSASTPPPINCMSHGAVATRPSRRNGPKLGWTLVKVQRVECERSRALRADSASNGADGSRSILTRPSTSLRLSNAAKLRPAVPALLA